MSLWDWIANQITDQVSSHMADNIVANMMRPEDPFIPEDVPGVIVHKAHAGNVQHYIQAMGAPCTVDRCGRSVIVQIDSSTEVGAHVLGVFQKEAPQYMQGPNQDMLAMSSYAQAASVVDVIAEVAAQVPQYVPETYEEDVYMRAMERYYGGDDPA